VVGGVVEGAVRGAAGLLCVLVVVLREEGLLWCGVVERKCDASRFVVGLGLLLIVVGGTARRIVCGRYEGQACGLTIGRMLMGTEPGIPAWLDPRNRNST
jgi:hypothetical protein